MQANLNALFKSHLDKTKPCGEGQDLWLEKYIQPSVGGNAKIHAKGVNNWEKGPNVPLL